MDRRCSVWARVGEPASAPLDRWELNGRNWKRPPQGEGRPRDSERRIVINDQFPRHSLAFVIRFLGAIKRQNRDGMDIC